jgi:hypothetical protein
LKSFQTAFQQLKANKTFYKLKALEAPAQKLRLKLLAALRDVGSYRRGGVERRFNTLNRLIIYNIAKAYHKV